jgi:hypothetical protein
MLCLKILGYVTTMRQILVFNLCVVTLYVQEDERKRKLDLEMGGWTEATAKTEDAIQAEPSDKNHPAAQGYADVVENKF